MNIALKKLWVWDISIRVAHWLLALCFATAYATGDSERWRLIHVYAGGAVLGVVGFRLIWGVFGTPHARFSQFVRSPMQGLRYLISLLSDSPDHYVGHNPAGGWAVLGLLGLSAATALTGWYMYDLNDAHWLEEIHELFANATLALVVLHITAVLVSSVVHRSNFVKGMVTGYKKMPETFATAQDKAVQFSWQVQLVGLVLLAVCITASEVCVQW